MYRVGIKCIGVEYFKYLSIIILPISSLHIFDTGSSFLYKYSGNENINKNHQYNWQNITIDIGFTITILVLSVKLKLCIVKYLKIYVSYVYKRFYLTVYILALLYTL